MEAIKEGVHEEYHQSIPLQEDQCIVLETFLEDASQGLKIPDTSCRFKIQPFMISLARVSLAADIAVSELLSTESVAAGLAEEAKIFSEIKVFNSQEVLDRFSKTYNEFLKKVQGNGFRRARVNGSRASLIVLSLTKIPGLLSVRDEQNVQQVVIEVGTIALAFSSLVASFDQPTRQAVLNRLLSVRVGVVRSSAEPTALSS